MEKERYRSVSYMPLFPSLASFCDQMCACFEFEAYDESLRLDRGGEGKKERKKRERKKEG